MSDAVSGLNIEVANEAIDLVTGDRAQDYGPATESFRRIASMWSAYLGVTITPRQVASMMILLKVSRDANGPKHDNPVDIIGYSILMDNLDS